MMITGGRRQHPDWGPEKLRQCSRLRPKPGVWSLEPAAEAATRSQLPTRNVNSSAPYPAMLIDSVKY